MTEAVIRAGTAEGLPWGLCGARGPGEERPGPSAFPVLGRLGLAPLWSLFPSLSWSPSSLKKFFCKDFFLNVSSVQLLSPV